LTHNGTTEYTAVGPHTIKYVNEASPLTLSQIERSVNNKGVTCSAGIVKNTEMADALMYASSSPNQQRTKTLSNHDVLD